MPAYYIRRCISLDCFPLTWYYVKTDSWNIVISFALAKTYLLLQKSGVKHTPSILKRTFKYK